MSLVSLVEVDTSDTGVLKRAIARSLGLIKFSSKNSDKIIIKPNLCYYYHPSTGDVTDPMFVGALIDVLRERFSSDLEFFVVEADASAMVCKYAFKMLGYEEMAEEKGVSLVNLSEERNQIFDIKVNDWYLRFRVPKILLESDFLVNVPKLKYMSNVKITCALKNMYGCNAFRRKSIYHMALNEAIVGINKLIRSSLVVVDGIMVSGRRTKRLGVVMASEDPVAIDAAASKIMGINPRSVDHIVLASEKGVGTMQFVAVGDSVSSFERLFPNLTVRDKARSIISSLYFRFFED